eukprot:UN27796
MKNSKSTTLKIKDGSCTARRKRRFLTVSQEFDAEIQASEEEAAAVEANVNDSEAMQTSMNDELSDVEGVSFTGNTEATTEAQLYIGFSLDQRRLE